MTRAGWTVAQARALLDPPIPLRTLQRLAAGLHPVSVERSHLHRPARRYPIAELQRAHAEWARRRHRTE